MDFNISGVNFFGPVAAPDRLHDQSGVYLVLTHDGKEWRILDVGESQNVRKRLQNHDRRDSWNRHAIGGQIAYAVKYCDGFSRMAFERLIRDQHDPPCGKR